MHNEPGVGCVISELKQKKVEKRIENWTIMEREHRNRGRFNIKMSSYQYRKSHCGDKMVVRSSYLHNGISYTGKMSSLYCRVTVKYIMIQNKTLIYIWDIFKGNNCKYNHPGQCSLYDNYSLYFILWRMKSLHMIVYWLCRELPRRNCW